MFLAFSFALGILVGVLYDALRPMRRASKTLAAALLDIVFCALTAGGFFCLAMSSRSGMLGLWELAAAAVGLLLYTHYLSAQVYRFFARGLDMLRALGKKFHKRVKKTVLSSKKYFIKMRECFIIRRDKRKL